MKDGKIHVPRVPERKEPFFESWAFACIVFAIILLLFGVVGHFEYIDLKGGN